MIKDIFSNGVFFAILAISVLLRLLVTLLQSLWNGFTWPSFHGGFRYYLISGSGKYWPAAEKRPKGSGAIQVVIEDGDMP